MHNISHAFFFSLFIFSLTNLTSQVGYWRSSLTSKTFSDCSKSYQALNAVALAADRCCPLDPITNMSICVSNSSTATQDWNSDSQCQQNYRGTLCLECVKGYVRVGDDCVVCARGASLNMAFMAGTLMVLPVFFGVLINLLCANKVDKADKAGNKVFGQIKIMITFIQILSSMKTTYNGIPWPLAFISFVIPLAAINLDIVGLFGANVCSMAVPFSGKFLVHMSLPPMLSLGIVAAYFASKFLKPPKTKELLAHRHAQTLKLLLGLILFMYPGLATRCFQMFKCSEFDGVEYAVLEADPSMICHTGSHSIFMTLAFAFIVLCEFKSGCLKGCCFGRLTFVVLLFHSADVIGIPLAMFIVLWRNRKYLYVEEGKEATEKQYEVEFELGGLYAQCEFDKSNQFF